MQLCDILHGQIHSVIIFAAVFYIASDICKRDGENVGCVPRTGVWALRKEARAC